MSTLDSTQVANTLRRLFGDMANDKQRIGELREKFIKEGLISPDEDLKQLVVRMSREDYKALYTGMLSQLYLAVKPEFGKMLYMLALARNATTVVEFGTSFGVSTIHLAAALRDNGGRGKLITTEFEPGKVAQAKRNLEEAGLVDLVEFREGDAMQTLQTELPAAIDLVLLDGAKNLYVPLLKLLEPRLKRGALVLADNADFEPDYLAYVRDPANGYVSLDLALEQGNEMSVRVVDSA
jgi:predicted O-methyltransferase YrrM